MKEERRTRIAEYIKIHNDVSMKELKSEFKVSMNTIRADIESLVESKTITKVYGGEPIDIEAVINKFNKKYEGLAIAKMETSEHLPPFEKSEDETLVNVARKAGKNLNMDLDISSFHAGAETHIYANNKNKYGVQLKPILIGLADVYNMHSADEQIDYKTYLKGYEFLRELFKVYNT